MSQFIVIPAQTRISITYQLRPNYKEIPAFAETTSV